ncbi:sepiapterin reductase-like [Prorops nasuta]|uniref:sepiapterin reductase-like n=1 Tax=Prorops nasuta TaxID=863751 RepID=UPI0034CF115A
MSIEPLSGKTFLIITGASRGIGQQISETFSSLLERGSFTLLLARDAELLESVLLTVKKFVDADFEAIDLGVATTIQLKAVITKALEKCKEKKFDRLVLVHNVGAMGDLSIRTEQMTSFEDWRSYYDLNVFSVATLNGVALNLFNDKSIRKVVINITSLCAISPMKSMGFYCSGKAAREMYFKVFALENPDVDVLNYAPGPVDTDMLQSVVRDAKDTEVKESFNTLLTKGTVLSTKETVNRLLEILQTHKYKSGDHVDYYDE